MPKVLVIGLFCEDMREEKSGSETLVGVLPDNINMPIPGALAKLGLYIRFHFDPAVDPGQIFTRIVHPNGEETKLGELDAAVVKKARDDARAAGVPIAGVISRAMIGNFPVKIPGIVRAIANVGGEDITCAMLNMKALPQPTPATASAQQPSQSPAAAPAKGS